MKAFLRRCACTFLVLFIWTFASHKPAFAADFTFSIDSLPKLIDCSADQFAYGEIVARLNRLAAQLVPWQSAGTITGKKSNEKVLYPVLCRTDGTLFGFDAWSPSCIVSGPSNCFTLYFSSERIAERVTAILSRCAGMLYAEQDTLVESCTADTVSFRSWGAESMSYEPYLNYAGRIAGGTVSVAVIDSGVYPHPVYAERMLESGYDYVDADRDATNDPYGHGTNVTGVVADCTQGFAVYFYPIRVLNAEGGGSVSNTINGIREAIEQKVDIINLSLATKTASSALDSAVVDARNAGITVIIAAGNASTDTAQVSPARLTDTGVIVVGAAEADGTKASYSNYGESIDLYAYGSRISCCSNSGGYTEETGTSIAAPHITGLAALMRLTHGDIGPEEIETRICLSTDQTEGVNIPELVRIIPTDPGFSLSILKMDMHDSVRLPLSARPAAALEPVSYTSSEPAVISICDGLLTPVAPGRAKIIAHCPGLDDIVFVAEVTDEECVKTVLPQNIKTVESEAFFGASVIIHVILPDGCETIGEYAFDQCEALRTVELPASIQSLPSSFSDAVVICQSDEAIEEYLKQHQISYILNP